MLQVAEKQHHQQLQEKQASAPPGDAAGRLDRLVGYLMEDREVLRVICAPPGFGRTTLAMRYAQLLFPQERVIRINGSSPGFLGLIDQGAVASQLAMQSQCNFESAGDGCRHSEPPDGSCLVIIDDLRRLDTVRSKTLSEAIDACLAQGDEVMIITTPANFSLGTLQPDRLMVNAIDLVLTVKELAEHKGMTLRQADGYFARMEGIPSMIWMNREEAVDCLLGGFSAEGLPSDFLQPAAAMLVLRSGTLDDLELLNLEVRSEIRQALYADYPLFGIKPGTDSFSAIPVSVQEIAQHPVFAKALLAKEHFLEDLLSLLLAKGDISRAIEVLTGLLSGKHRTAWVCRYGWEIIDRGYVRDLASVSEGVFGSLGAPEDYLSLRAWMSYLMGRGSESRMRIAEGLKCAPGPPVLHSLLSLSVILELSSQMGIGAQATQISQAFAEIGASEDNLMEAEALKKTLCNLECLGDSGTAKACPFCVVDQQTTCVGWALVHRALSWKQAEQENTIDDDEEESVNGSLPWFMAKAHSLRHTAYYRIALAALAARLQSEATPLFQEVSLEVARITVPLLARGIQRISDALLVRLMQGLGALDDKNDAAIQHATMRTTSLLATLQSAGCLSLFSHWASWQFGARQEMVLPEAGSHGQNTDEQAISASENIYIVEVPQPMLIFTFFGGFKARFANGIVIDDERWHRKGLRGFLTLLALGRGGEASKDFIFSQLWPGSDKLHARDSFYSILKVLKAILATAGFQQEVIIRTDGFCRLNRTLVDADVFTFDKLVRKAASSRLQDAERMQLYSQIDELYAGDLIDVDVKDSLVTSQSWYRSVFVDTMIAASHFAQEANEGLASLWFARRAYEHGLGREDVFRTLMQAQSFNGQYDEAQRTFDRCRLYMEREFGMLPSQETLDSYDEYVTRRRLQHAR